ncbi:MAG: D-alanyl-D-alanine carboxypeptidase/D-alanyl-D-alanine-endopeptidase [Gemmatimonadales bacterium]|nr:D-alanyl-D-alanine carboxypeptidase/D-alanyl-D-alanine-endopeptidase [Gemmatimonadales bacterium]
MRTLACCTLTILLLAGATVQALEAQRNLAKRVTKRLENPPFDRNLWGVVLTDLDGRILFSRNAERLFIPASNTKLAVAAVAAALLPPDWKVRTSVYSSGPVVEGELQGDLVLYGRGDPTFSRRCYAGDTTQAGVCVDDPMQPLRILAGQLRTRGIRTVTGSLVGDGSYFEPTLVHPSWEGYDLNWWYAAPVSGLAVNDNSIDLEYGPGPAEGAPVKISFTPDLGNLTLENRTWTGPAGSRRTIDFFRRPGSLDLWAAGSVALNSGTRTEYFAVPDPNYFTAQAFRRVLADSGISVAGPTQSTTDSTRYQHLRLGAAVAEVTSRPLTDWIFPVLNTSQNFFAETLLKQLGKQFGAEGSWKEGLEVERRFLIDSVGIDSTHFSFRDGSGLASSNVVTPIAFAKLLGYIRRHPHYATFAAGLPESAQRGSLKRRFVGTPLEGRVRAKTGSISRVNSLSGYIETVKGKTLVFAILANNHARGGSEMIRQIDSIVVEMGR